MVRGKGRQLDGRNLVAVAVAYLVTIESWRNEDRVCEGEMCLVTRDMG